MMERGDRVEDAEEESSRKPVVESDGNMPLANAVNVQNFRSAAEAALSNCLKERMYARSRSAQKLI